MSEGNEAVYLSTSPKLRSLQGLQPLLQARVVLAWPRPGARPAQGVLAWGRKPSARRAEALATRLCLPVLRLEDGFLRSFGTGDTHPPLSLVVDELGIYYDSTRPSSLEALLASGVDVLAGLGGDVARAKGFVLRHGLSKYNHAGEWAGLDCFTSLAIREGRADCGEGREHEDGLPRFARNVGVPSDRDFEGRRDAAIPPSATSAAQRLTQRVLVIDQTAGDLSVALGGATAQTFADMLSAARAENPGATVYVKTHPEVTTGRKGGYLTHVQDAVSPGGQRTVVLRGLMNPLRLVEQMDRVYVVSSTMGFEALLAGKPVSCFGVPWYAGWGATDDRCTHSPAWARRTRTRTVDELFAAAYFHYTRYVNPLTHKRGTIFDVMQWLARQREVLGLSTQSGPMHGGCGGGDGSTGAGDGLPRFARHDDGISPAPRHAAPATAVHRKTPDMPALGNRAALATAAPEKAIVMARRAVPWKPTHPCEELSDTPNPSHLAAGRLMVIGFPRWRRYNLAPIFSLLPGRLHFAPHASKAAALNPCSTDALLYWGRTAPPGVEALAGDTGAQLLRMEDGFVRGVGLGSDLLRPLSLVLDGRGIYFDPSSTSDLEHLLNTRAFTADDVERAMAVRRFMVQHGITKYNVESRDAARWAVRAGQRVVLVPGQVEDDASIRFGCTHVRSNLALLKEARKACPDGFIVYKPHPDVMSGNRAGRVAMDEARALADWVETGLSVVSCLDACDEVHTMTSLTGFDALLRGKRVVTYGQPFYAGWGLTHDRAGEGGAPTPAFARRTRHLALDELVAGTLLHYPVYWDWKLKGFTTCEAVLNALLAERTALEAGKGLESLHLGWTRRQLRKLRVLWRAWTHSI